MLKIGLLALAVTFSLAQAASADQSECAAQVNRANNEYTAKSAAALSVYNDLVSALGSSQGPNGTLSTADLNDGEQSNIKSIQYQSNALAELRITYLKRYKYIVSQYCK